MVVTELFEESNKTAVLTYGRMNPPTIGHMVLIDKVLSIPGDHFIFVSHTQDSKKNPLTAQEKISLLNKVYPGQDCFHAASTENPTIVTVAAGLSKQGYKNLIIVVGSDRVASFDELFTKYNGVFNDKGQGFKFDSINVVSAGERDPDADDVSGMSASKMRELAVTGDIEGFKQGLPPALHKDAANIMQKIASVLVPVKTKKVKESFAKKNITTKAGLIEQTKKITKKMHENARNGDVAAVTACIKKLMPIVENAHKALAESIAEEVTRAVKVADRNRDDIFEIK